MYVLVEVGVLSVFAAFPFVSSISDVFDTVLAWLAFDGFYGIRSDIGRNRFSFSSALACNITRP